MKQIQTGFTLIELMLVIVILAILLTIGVPSFREIIMNNRITSSANEFATALSLARIQAIKNGSGTVIVATTGGGSSNEWGKGFTVSLWDDADYDSTVDSGEIGTTLRQFQAFSGEVEMDATGNITQISFLPTGEFNSGSTPPDSEDFNLCDSRSGKTGRQFTLNISGNFVLEREHTCP
ncbi:MAG: prepilin-type N-terminal cleavage/methylation domain-containing protein [Gammaproteobacteria bacterium]|nr:prepilin-type N-terminal cleavage/methylation domain-containing protein [Gammaproteobacteria bacterium]